MTKGRTAAQNLTFSQCDALIFAPDAGALLQVCGISLLERSLRILQRLGCSEVTVLADASEEIALALSKPSWARSEIAVSVRSLRGKAPQPDRAGRPVLITSASGYVEPRLLQALLDRGRPGIIVDSNPQAELLSSGLRTTHGWFCGAALVDARRHLLETNEPSLFPDILAAAESGELEIIDVEKEPRYVTSLRREIRPLWFPVPSPQQRRHAENLILNAAQNGALDLPAKVHAPIETWIVRRLCRAPITPTQITLLTAAVSGVTTWNFATGHLIAGTLLALTVGVLDGLDGKQARVKVETTELGKREHLLDYVLELSWWSALAFHFASMHQLPQAGWWLALLFVADLIDRLAKANVKRLTGRNLDDVSPFDRLVRLIGGRRNIYVWILAAGLALGVADKAFFGLCAWGGMTAAIHVFRAVAIRRQRSQLA